MLAPGTRLGPCEIEALAGSGGVGQVHRARDARRGAVAITLINNWPVLLSGQQPER
jgi:hypothetical protein